MDWTVLGIMIAYFAVVFAVGVATGRESGTVESYYLADRKLGGFLTAMTYLASLVSAGALVGWTALAYSWGTFFIWAAVAVTLSTFLSWYFLGPRVMTVSKELRAITIPDFVESRFYSKAARVVSSLVLIIFMVPLMVSNYKAAGLMFNMVTGLDYEAAVWLFGAIVFLYVAFGGYRAVVWTDTIQGLIMLTGVAMLIIAAVSAVDEPLGSAYAQQNPAGVVNWPIGVAPGGNYFFSFVLLTFFGALGAPYYLVRYYSLRDARSLRAGFTTVIGIAVVLEVVIVLLGLYGRVLFPDLDSPDNTVLTMIRNLLPSAAGGVVLAALSAAMMSTIDSILLVIASTVEHDLLGKSLGYQVQERWRVGIARLTTLVAGIVSIVWALNPPELLALLLYPAWGVLGLVFSILFIGGLFWRRFNREGALTAMIAAPVAFVTWHQLGNPLGLFNIQVALLMTIPLTLLVTYLTPPPPEPILARFFREGTPPAGATAATD